MTGTLRILRLQLYPLHPAVPLGVGMEFVKCGSGGPPPPPNSGLKGRASVVQALTIGCGQLLSIGITV